MSIKSDVTELEAVKLEMKNLRDRIKNLRTREKEIEQKIKEYLESKGQYGLKHQGTAIVVEEKEARARKKAKEKDLDALKVLEKFGIQNGEQLLAELLEARKGDPVASQKLLIKKYKDT